VNPFKEPEMNKRMIWMLSAALLSGVSVAAIASNHGMERHEGQRSHGKNAGVKGTEAQLARLESALKLEDAQRPAWQAFAKDIQAVAQARELIDLCLMAQKQALDALRLAAPEAAHG
jgi:hypothetical protein